nr:transglycosylase family protein [Nocardia brasiliensis]
MNGVRWRLRLEPCAPLNRTVLAVGGQFGGWPSNAGRAEQIRVAENVLAAQGVGAWPVCGAHL